MQTRKLILIAAVLYVAYLALKHHAPSGPAGSPVVDGVAVTGRQVD